MFINAELRPDLISLRSFLSLHMAGSSNQQLDQMAAAAFNALSNFGPVALPVALRVSTPQADEFKSINPEDCSQPSFMSDFASRPLVASSHDGFPHVDYIESSSPRYNYPAENFFFSQALKFPPEDLENCPGFDPSMLPDDDSYIDKWDLGGTTTDPAMYSETQLMGNKFYRQNGRKSPRSNEFAPLSTSPAGCSPFFIPTTSPDYNIFENMAGHSFEEFDGLNVSGDDQDLPNVLPHGPISAYADQCWDERPPNMTLIDATEPAWSLSFESSLDQTGGSLVTPSMLPSPTSQEAVLYTKISPGTFHTAPLDNFSSLHQSPSVCGPDLNDMISSEYSQRFYSEDLAIESPTLGPGPCWGVSSAPTSSPTKQVPPLLEYGIDYDEVELPSRQNSPAYNSTREDGQAEALDQEIEHTKGIARKALKLMLVRRPTLEHLSISSPSENATFENIDASNLESNSGRNAEMVVDLLHPEHRDDFLIRARLAGMTYKDIRRVGGFAEAESTLRGRHRSLTKEKHERVRRPKWENKDVRLLREAVRKLTNSSNLTDVKVSWREVADYIWEHGGSYRFGSATCSRRWNELKMSFANTAARARKRLRDTASSSS